MVLDSGLSLDGGDLSDTRTDAGTPGPNHRKVREYSSTNQFGGQGDSSGCDAPPQGGFTHGHVVASTALGAGTTVGSGYGGAGWNAFDPQGNAWEIDGVAYDAVLVSYDGSVTPPNGSCSDPGQGGIFAGDLYNPSAPVNGACPGAATCPGSLGKSYEEFGARVSNLSFGSQDNSYSVADIDVDNYILLKQDAMVFISAGNYSTDIDPPGGDQIPDSLTLGSPGHDQERFCDWRQPQRGWQRAGEPCWIFECRSGGQLHGQPDCAAADGPGFGPWQSAGRAVGVCVSIE